MSPACQAGRPVTGHRVAVAVLLAAWAWCAWQAVHEHAWPLAALCVACAAVTAAVGWPTARTESSLEVEARLAANPVDVSELGPSGSTSTDPGRGPVPAPGVTHQTTNDQET